MTEEVPLEKRLIKRVGLLVAFIISAVVGPAISPFITDWLRDNYESAGAAVFWLRGLQIGLFVISAAAALVLLLTLLVRRWRQATWAPIWRALWERRPVAHKTLTERVEAARTDGYSERDAEIVKERAGARQPQLVIDQQGSWADDATFLIRNWGYAARDLEVTAHPDELTLRRPFFIAGEFGDTIPGSVPGKAFRGVPTTKGLESGITFRISFTDEVGDRKSIEQFLPPEDLFANQNETREEAYQRGRDELQAEIDAARARPSIKPQWLLAAMPKEQGMYMISNSAKGSTARDVEITAPTNRFTFIGAPQWEDLSVAKDAEEATDTGLAVFKGLVGEFGRAFGVEVTVSWTDENGDRWDLSHVPIEGTKRQLY